MTVYWRDHKRGQNLILSEEEGQEQVIGGFRDTQRGIDAYAQTFSYEPGRSQKGFATIEDAKEFVESFRPWELHGATGVTVDSESRPIADVGSGDEPTDEPTDEPADEPPDGPPDGPTPSNQPTESVVPERQPRNRWWELWRKG